MVGGEVPKTEVWTYNGVEPGPVLRLRQGTPFRATVENRLAETTTVHWHGIRLPNAMDGVPGITQPPIPPGDISTMPSPRLMPGHSGITRTTTAWCRWAGASPAR